MLEREVNVLAREYEYLNIQSSLMNNLNLDDYLVSKINAEEAAVKKHSSCKYLPGESDGKMRNRGQGSRVQ